MADLIVVHSKFDGVWPFAANHFHTLWPKAKFIRLAWKDDRPLGEVVEDPNQEILYLIDKEEPTRKDLYELAGEILALEEENAAEEGKSVEELRLEGVTKAYEEITADEEIMTEEEEEAYKEEMTDEDMAAEEDKADQDKAVGEDNAVYAAVQLIAGRGRYAGNITRLASFGVPVTPQCLAKFGRLEEATFQAAYGPESELDEECKEQLSQAGVRLRNHQSEGFWAQSVAEFALALTICGLRRIPQWHHQIMYDLSAWDHNPPEEMGAPHDKGEQFSDNRDFVNGTLCGKRVRIVGAGNIASRYASYASMMGADVAAWDPYASEPCFHRSGARRILHMDQLFEDADVFAPMVPLNNSTHHLVKAEHIDALPKGCLVVLATRALICDMDAIRRRATQGEISLAADVWDEEPLPPSDPVHGRDNVVHTPHIAGRTRDANIAWAEMLAEQFDPK